LAGIAGNIGAVARPEKASESEENGYARYLAA
jgi:hypothetical protein